MLLIDIFQTLIINKYYIVIYVILNLKTELILRKKFKVPIELSNYPRHISK